MLDAQWRKQVNRLRREYLKAYLKDPPDPEEIARIERGLREALDSIGFVATDIDAIDTAETS